MNVDQINATPMWLLLASIIVFFLVFTIIKLEKRIHELEQAKYRTESVNNMTKLQLKSIAYGVKGVSEILTLLNEIKSDKKALTEDYKIRSTSLITQTQKQVEALVVSLERACELIYEEKDFSRSGVKA